MHFSRQKLHNCGNSVPSSLVVTSYREPDNSETLQIHISVLQYLKTGPDNCTHSNFIICRAYTSTNTVRMDGTCNMHMEVRNAQKNINLVSLNKSNNTRDTCQLKDNIKMDIKRIGYYCVDWIHLARDKD